MYKTSAGSIPQQLRRVSEIIAMSKCIQKIHGINCLYEICRCSVVTVDYIQVFNLLL